MHGVLNRALNGVKVSGAYAVEGREEMPENLLQKKLIGYIFHELTKDGKILQSEQTITGAITDSICAKFRTWYDAETRQRGSVSIENPRSILESVLRRFGLTVDEFLNNLKLEIGGIIERAKFHDRIFGQIP